MKVKILLAMLIIISSVCLFSCSSSINPLSNGETPELFPIRQNNKWGFINRKGEVVIQPQFEIALPFSEGLATACISSGKCGYIDNAGKFVINPQFNFSFRFSEGLAAVISENKMGYIDKTGKFAINPQFSTYGGPDGGSFSTFSESLALVKIGEKFGFIDKAGKIIINPQFEAATPFFDELAAARIGDKWGFIDKEGKIIINPQFESAQPFFKGLAAVLIGKQWGYIDKTGKIIINPQFDGAEPFSNEGLALVILNSKVGFIDKEGKYTVNPQFENPLYYRIEELFVITSDLGKLSVSESLIPVRLGGKVGYANTSGQIVINPQFSEAFPFYGGMALIINRGDGPRSEEFGWIDKEGKYVWRETKEPIKNSSNISVNTNAGNSGNYNTSSNMASNSAMPPVNSNASNASSQRTGRLTTDTNIRSEANKDAASLGIHFKGAKISITDETSFTNEKGEPTTWYRIKVTEYGCSANTNLGCGKNTPNDSDEGWVNAKNVLLD